MKRTDYYYFDYSRLKALLCDNMPLWSFCLFDGRCKARCVQFVACKKPTSLHVTNFLVEAFQHCGIPAGLYVDSDELFRSPRMQAFAAMIREHGFQPSYFQLEQLPAHSPRSTGRVEAGRCVFEAYEKLIRLNHTKQNLESLNAFAFKVFGGVST